MAQQGQADPARLLELIGASWTTQALRAAVELGVVDALAAGPRATADVADDLDIDLGSLARLVRALCTLEICATAEADQVSLTPMGALLASGHASLGPWARWWGGPVWVEWVGLAEAIRTGRPVRSGDGFAGHGDDTARAELFDAAMAGLSALEVPGIVDQLGLRGDELVVDLGGGSGSLMTGVLLRHPEARGLVVDLPNAVAAARLSMAEKGLAGRCEAVEGDLFGPVPGGGDVYVLKSVLHDWDDEGVRRILRACIAGAGHDARVLVVERTVGDPVDGSAVERSTALMDLHMLVAQGGRERTEAELRSLLGSAGLRVTDVRRCSGALAVIDAVSTGAGAPPGQPPG